MTEEVKEVPEVEEPKEPELTLDQKVELLGDHMANVINVLIYLGQRIEAVEDFLEEITVEEEEGPEHGGH